MVVRRWRLGLTGALSCVLVLAGCAASALNAVTSRSGYSVVEDIRYRDGERGTFDLYIPDGADANSPLVVFFYGGSWDSGSKDIYLFVGQSLASEGVIVAVPDYRVYPQVVFPGFVEDGAAAVRAIAQAVRQGAYGVPAGNHPTFVMGHSAGAQIAALLSLDERYLGRAGFSAGNIRGFIGLAGPYDFLPLDEERYKRIFPPATRDASQPINFVTGNEPPMLLIAGTADTTVEPRNTRSLAAKVRAEGGSVQEIIVPGLDHVGAVAALATALPSGGETVRAAVLRFIESRS